MKLVNPNKVGIERKFRFYAIFTNCDDFKDEFTDGDAFKTGCFGCEHLNNSSSTYSDISCDMPAHVIAFAPIRKDVDDTVMTNCSSFEARSSYGNSYLRGGCLSCKYCYRGAGKSKCQHSYSVSQEVYRVG